MGPDPRHAAIIIQELGLQDSKSLVISIAKADVDEDPEKLDQLSTTKCKSLVAGANYLAVGRPDIQYICKEFSMGTSSLSKQDRERLKRV